VRGERGRERGSAEPLPLELEWGDKPFGAAAAAAAAAAAPAASAPEAAATDAAAAGSAGLTPARARRSSNCTALKLYPSSRASTSIVAARCGRGLESGGGNLCMSFSLGG
jgi:hypothetical protein